MEMVKEDLAEALQIVEEMDKEVSSLQSELQESLTRQRKLENLDGRRALGSRRSRKWP